MPTITEIFINLGGVEGISKFVGEVILSIGGGAVLFGLFWKFWESRNLQNLRQRHSKELENIKNRYTQELETDKNRYARELEADKFKYNSELEKQKQNYTVELSQIKANVDSTLESLRAALHVATHEQETRFSEWHQRQVTILVELYRLLFRAEETLRPGLQDLQGGPIAATVDAFDEARRYLEENLVFIPDNVEKLAFDSLNSIAFLLRYGSDIDSTATAAGMETQEVVRVLMEKAGTEIPQLRKGIRQQVQTILSGKSDSLHTS